jgi:hypothetical protein
MKEVRKNFIVPPDVDLSDAASSDLVAALASRLAPGLERSVGPVQWKTGDEAGVDWTAEGFVDGTFVVICLRPSSREVQFLAMTGFTPPFTDGPRWVNALLLGILGASIAVGVMMRSFWWGVLALIAPVAFWIGVDVVLKEAKQRRTDRAFDGAAWHRRFTDAVEGTSSAGRDIVR